MSQANEAITTSTCAVHQCQKRRYLRGWCKTHYEQNRIHGSPLTRRDHISRFVANTIASDTAECISWPYSRNRGGYGRYTPVKYGGRVLAHRYICEQANGAPPEDRQFVAHQCANPSCVNPRHLRWSSHAENMADKLIHGTQPRGSEMPWSILNEDQVRDILAQRANAINALAVKHGVNAEMIRKIWDGRNWVWMKDK